MIRPSPAPAAGKQRLVRRGRRIDLELQSADVRSVFPVLGDIGRVNFVLDDSVEGTVTAYLQDVTWDEALYWILRAMRLEAQRSGNVIYVTKDD